MTLGKKQAVMWPEVFFKILNFTKSFCHSTKPRIYQNTTQHLSEFLGRSLVGFHGTVSFLLPTSFCGPESPRPSDQQRVKAAPSERDVSIEV